MRGQVDEPTKKRRAAELLAIAAQNRATWAAAHIGTEAAVLFETRLEDGRWVGHAADHTLVAAPPPADDRASLENHLGRVRVDAVDPEVRDRVAGRILSLSPPPIGVAVDAR
jgi:tRNA A37 methylthiotransferase MiaB